MNHGSSWLDFIFPFATEKGEVQMTKPPWFTLTEGVRATATWTATGRGSATLRIRADFSAMWTGSLYCLSKYLAFPTIFDLTALSFHSLYKLLLC